MTANGWLQILIFFGLVVAVTRPLGIYLYRVFEGTPPLPRILGRFERALYRISGVDPTREHTWKQYAGALLAFSLVSMLVTYVILRLQGSLPLNPQGMKAIVPNLAFNTAASFTTNTNWQSYAGESTMSYFSQMVGLTWHNFTSAAVGIGIALALARGLTRTAGPDGKKTLGNFWVDITRGTIYVLLPICTIYALILISQGVIQNFDAYREVTTLEGGKQLIALGPVASQEAIKMLGTNGGGFFNANSAHPFENPTALANLLQMLSIFAIPAALTYTYGRMARSQRQGWAIFAAMSVLFAVGVAVAYSAEVGNMEGKEVRFGIANSALFATVTTDASCGAVNSMHDSFTPLGGLVPLANIQLGEVVFGGVGAGLYGMLIYVLLAVFIAGLMVGRTPEYLGKKIEAREMKLAMLYVLIFPLLILGLTGWAAVSATAMSGLNNAGPHGLSEMLYAFSSGAGNNGSAFAGLTATNNFWTIGLATSMLVGRFWMIIPALAIAGSMVGKKIVPPGPGTFPTNGPLFTALLIAVVVIVGALTFFPALTLSPVVEHMLAATGKTF
jgi:potassium-transporting ATPase potassium-binding subunit